MTAKELEATMVMLNDVGHVLQTMHNILIEIDLVEGLAGHKFLHLKTGEKHHISTAIALLGELTTEKTHDLAERFGLKNPC